ncbi:hypothetical protein GCM10011492_11100 [Flexivirga endophytica]|uniref:Beta-lactamase-related domain-containing protein n=1 Tax=Flexivirga endophytica TaxID=1849103 RepID=A0A916SZB7_9MICO|nr:serine hydrolase domain-containing protein [Flexivirga endophytica]GGB23051.1 hypothetical protein GCM10011492_11100 [Flexivirga endophytica]GHB56949.1 hypothetical protein GCM10008112_27640 [Flexivirga endophytica]
MPEFAMLPHLSEIALSASKAVVGVSRAGERIFARVGDVDEHSIFRIASLTKTFTAVATVRAAAAAGVPLHTSVRQLMPPLKSRWSADRDITVEHLLAQTSGLTPAVTAADAAAVGEGDDALLAVCEFVVRAGSDRRPGDRWEYYNGNYFLAGAVTAALASCSYEDTLERLVLAPAGRLGGYRTAMLLLPRVEFAAVALANDASALPAIARVLSDLQEGVTGDDLTAAIAAFAA